MPWNLIETERTTTGGVLESDSHKFALSTTPLGRIGQPEDIAHSVSAFSGS